MIHEILSRGKAKIANYVPTVPALNFLNCCTMAGWQYCNKSYNLAFPYGVIELFLLYTIDGMGKMEINGTTYTLPPNSMILVQPYTPMTYYTDPRTGFWEYYWLDLTGEKSTTIARKLWNNGHFFLQELPTLTNCFNDLMNESTSELVRSAYVDQIFQIVLSQTVFKAKNEDTIVEQIIRYLAQNYAEQIDLQQMSTQFFLSKCQIIRIVRNRTGYTPHEYLTLLRLNKACELLQYSEMSIENIGKAVGFSNKSHFSAIFKRIYKISPSNFRLQCKP